MISSEELVKHIPEFNANLKSVQYHIPSTPVQTPDLLPLNSFYYKIIGKNYSLLGDLFILFTRYQDTPFLKEISLSAVFY